MSLNMDLIESGYIEGEEPSEKATKGKFLCKHADKDTCDFDPDKQSCWTPWLGDEGCEHMVVMEAPSNNYGGGPWIAPRLANYADSDDKEMKDKTFRRFISFLRKEIGSYPYITDAVKCGIGGLAAARKSQLLKKRYKHCRGYLEKEIELLNPKFLIAVGRFADKNVRELDVVKERGIEVISLLHFSGQANLQLRIEDKEKYIWPYQLKKILADKLPSMGELSFFKKR
jgi:hypothetical protein